jgi:nucleoside-diphosphate-sugar epimerase
MTSPSQARRVLVTGGPGFIGRRVVDRFLQTNWSVTSFSLPGEAPMPHWGSDLRMAHGDICNTEDVARATEGANLVIHLAAVVGLAGEYEKQYAIIAEGTHNICNAAASTGARVLVASSIAVYGDKIQTEICHEEVGFGAWQGAYGRAKQAQETAARDVCAAHGLALTIIRPGNVYGLGGSSAWGDRLIAAFRQTGGAVIGDAEHNNAGLVYVENLADAILLAATNERAIGRVYNVCDQEPVTWRRFANDMADIAGVPPPPSLSLLALVDAARNNEDPASLVGPKDAALPSLEGLNLVGYDNRFPSERIRKELGWRPRFTYGEAIAEMRREWNAI